MRLMLFVAKILLILVFVPNVLSQFPSQATVAFKLTSTAPLDPTTEPTTSPTVEPTSFPSHNPSSFPTHIPTSNPTPNPSSCPTARPTRDPTSEPSAEPSAMPTIEPSAHPTAEPSSLPSAIPTAKPTAFPTPEPSASPTILPTSEPTVTPTADPSPSPTAYPTSNPTADPTSFPTADPTASPTADPTAIPTTEPSSVPSVEPTSGPTSEPTTLPTPGPSATPTAAPTAHPTRRPTRVPTAKPTSFPTAEPTPSPTPNNPRYFNCGECQFSNLTTGECSFGNETVILMCGNSNKCIYSVPAFSLSPGAQLTTYSAELEHCDLIIFAADTIVIPINSAIMNPSVNLTAYGKITIEGIIDTSGLGPLSGPGSPDISTWGASYGGSGGRPSCSGYFSNTAEQIGSFFVPSNILENELLTFGSGGYGGRGGGRIFIATNDTLNIATSGQLLSNGGSNATSINEGSGSGGSIVLIAGLLTGGGLVSVRGGDALGNGGAGGGGRITVEVGSPLGSLTSLIVFTTDGGQPLGLIPNSGFNSTCQRGGAGSLFLVQPDTFSLATNGEYIATQAIITSSEITFAGTFINQIPSYTQSMSALGTSLLLSNNLDLPSTTVTLSQSNLVVYQVNSTTNNYFQLNGLNFTSLSVNFQSIELSAHSAVLFPENLFVSFSLTTYTTTIQTSSNILFNYQLFLTSQGNITINGDLNFTNAVATSYESLFAPSALVSIDSGDYILITSVKSPSIQMSSTNLILLESGKLVADTRMGIVIATLDSIATQQSSMMKAPSVNLTSTGKITLQGIIDTSGLGPERGLGTPDDVTWGGSYGGSGGRPSCNGAFSNTIDQIGSFYVPSNLYSEANPTYGSGGYGGRGGGRIIITTSSTLNLASGQLLASGSSNFGDVSAGAGSGGSIVLFAKSIFGSGIVSAEGGYTLGSGGAGGGGRITVEVSSTNAIPSSIVFSTIGGLAQSENSIYNFTCQQGGTGTIFIGQLVTSGDLSDSSNSENLYIVESTKFETRALAAAESSLSFIAGQVDIRGNGSSLAGTFINYLPTNTRSVTSSKSLLLLSNNVNLLSLSQCSAGKLGFSNCSSISLTDSALALYQVNSTTNPYNSISGLNFSSLSISSEIFELNSNSSILFPDNVFVALNLSTTTTTIVSSASILFNYQLYLASAGNVTIDGELNFNNSIAGSYGSLFASNSLVSIDSGASVTVNSIRSPNTKIKALVVNVKSKGLIAAMAGELQSSCLLNMHISNFTCNKRDSSYNGPISGNGTAIVTASKSLNFESSSEVRGSTLLLCSPFIEVHSSAVVNASSRGCSTNYGPGSGSFAIFKPLGASGGGAGAGGAGGTGSGGSLGGATYLSDNLISAGSGGGCNNDTSRFGGSGGGIIFLMSNETFINDGKISASGGNGFASTNMACGGGAGGSIFLISPSLKGSGSFLMTGGIGGSANSTAGGGGGGGNSAFYKNKNLELPSYEQFTGRIDLTGGSAGTSMSQSELQPASSGSVGMLPICPAGMGNNNQTNGVSDGAVCSPCGTSYFKSDPPSSAACTPCSNKRGRSSYVSCGFDSGDSFGDLNACPTTSSCPYTCASGFITEDCFSPFIVVIFNLGYWACSQKQIESSNDLVCMWGGFILDFVALIVGILVVLKLYRLRENQKFFDEMNKERQKIALLGGPQDGNSLRSPLYSNESLVSRDSSGAARKTMFHYLKAAAKDDKELRLAMRMVDSDLSYHACRIYLQGSNHPTASKGGSWHLDRRRPTCLRPMLKRIEYEKFADKINQEMLWNKSWVEKISYYCVMIFLNVIAAPLIAPYMLRLRTAKATKLIQLINAYDHSFCKSPVQQKDCASIRIGISPDCTLAYIDLLFDETMFDHVYSPLIKVGQPKLPAAFKLGGLGTYFSPYFVDTNDIILQAMAHTDVASTFIDEAFIDFVVELNTRLRTISRMSLRNGLYRLIKFLSSDKITKALGGITVQLCLFENKLAIANLLNPRPMSDQAPDQQQQQQQQQTGWNRDGGDIDAIAALESAAGLAHGGSKHFSSNSEFVHTASMSYPTRPNAAASSASPTRGGTGTTSANCEDEEDNEVGDADDGTKSIKLSLFGDVDSFRLSYDQPGIVGDIRRLLGPAIVSNSTATNAITTNAGAGPDAMGSPSESINISSMKRSTFEVTEHALSSDGPAAGADLPNLRKHNQQINKSRAISTESIGISKRLSNIGEMATKGLFSFLSNPLDRYRNSHELSFTEAITEVKAGRLSLGIFISHPKMDSFDTLIEDDDFESDNEEDQVIHLQYTQPDLLLQSTGSSKENKPKAGVFGGAAVTSTSFLQANNKKEANSNPLLQGQPIGARKGSFTSPYGAKAAEMDKFYRIVKAASQFNADDTEHEQEQTVNVQSGHQQSNIGARETEGVSTKEAYNTPITPERLYYNPDSAVAASSSSITPISAVNSYYDFDSPLPRSVDHRYSDAYTVKSEISDFANPSISHSNASNNEHVSSSSSNPLHSRVVVRDDNDSSKAKPQSSYFAFPASRSTSTDINSNNRSRMHSGEVEGETALDSDREDGEEDSDTTRNSMLMGIVQQDLFESVKPQEREQQKWLRSLRSVRRANTLQRYAGVDLAPSCHQHEVTPWRMLMSGSIVPGIGSAGMVSDSIENGEGERAGADNADTGRDSSVDHVRFSDIAMSAHNAAAMMLSTTSNEVLPNPSSPFSLAPALSSTPSPVSANASIKRHKRPFLLKVWDTFIVSVFARIFLGGNVYPKGSAKLRSVLGFLIVFHSVLDLGLLIDIATTFFCLWTTSCVRLSSHTALLLMFTIWPGAVVLSPITGLICVLLGPSSKLSRIHASWSRLAIISDIVILVVFIYKRENAPNYFAYIVATLFGSRIVQTFAVDLYIAHVDQIRWTRGWDGLVTSLYADNDKKMAIRSD